MLEFKQELTGLVFSSVPYYTSELPPSPEDLVFLHGSEASEALHPHSRES